MNVIQQAWVMRDSAQFFGALAPFLMSFSSAWLAFHVSLRAACGDGGGGGGGGGTQKTIFKFL